ncbi:hypothetical protein RVS70_03645 [Virgibacillus sp. M23]|uniref:hypothetical protein n=1 Tax=Virgibacillus sp. M23 TaxID=3079030 RepID=UPI002A90B889|nr:hypothetical protein [Virgibacillus sp. M23]MDY7043290.1 hypothetical protein [Virgibacillus sp. M23]
MENSTERQILEELKNINKSLQHRSNKIDDMENGGKPLFIIGDILKSLFIGVLIVGPAIAVAIVAFQVISGWQFN